MSVKSLNLVQLIGNLTRDPELRYTPQGTAVCTIGLATNRSWTNDTGDKNEETEYHRLVAWSKLAEICGQLLRKGRKIFAEGRLQTREWTTQDGQKRQTTEVVMDNMIILDSPKADAGENGSYAYPAASDDSSSSASKSTDDGKKQKSTKKAADEKPKDEPSEAEDISDDIPF